MSLIELRLAVPADIVTVLDFWTMAAEDAHRPADSPAALARLLDRDPEALLLAHLCGAVDNILVGTVIAGWDGWRGHAYRLAVHPDHRRQGIGRLLLRRAEERLVALGAGRADAMVLDDNELAHFTWRRSGYRRQPEWSRWVKPLGSDRTG